ncbi:MAG: Hsp20/alpha crystallin family protein, partial [Deltaproteobacteria bacterium]|nr:Hsp20/alpha crystallin family protein [Deltaproteobacteria bacterium]
NKVLTIRVELPGVRAEDIEISILRNNLNIKAHKYECFEDNTTNYICMERSFGHIFRAVEVPVPVNTSEIKALYSKGILQITLPRIEEKRGQPKKIKVETDEA